jgi:hypothetical protein
LGAPPPLFRERPVYRRGFASVTQILDDAKPTISDNDPLSLPNRDFHPLRGRGPAQSIPLMSRQFGEKCAFQAKVIATVNDGILKSLMTSKGPL